MSARQQGSGDGEHACLDLPTNRISHLLDSTILQLGKAASWLWLATLAVVITNVVNRFILDRGSIALEELSWHFFGAAMVLTLAYAVVTDDHVRVDVIREKMTLRTQAWIELLAIVILLLPILYIVLVELYQYGYRSFERGERSQAPSGLPYRFIIKTVIPIGLSLVAIAIVSRALRCSTLLFGYPRRFLSPAERDQRPSD
ncbi:TRAP-type mannitol/chloroaromatic compound transport system, small permease component [Franzmannia pantelleriensis]|uniref:TRAP transporter small permease protein n=1 Tax=Franzmannia pantelleriensis TaxID=48727 RepID=A0A1G9RY22_9GAMM|nr:TRAP transporter small permease subunit [Halomonas pantelleriensis]SDM28159.1 TRAP-type mannitol/chloroaromatic compound transport system, small permease component [Halomonas pantelleriensis]